MFFMLFIDFRVLTFSANIEHVTPSLLAEIELEFRKLNKITLHQLRMSIIQINKLMLNSLSVPGALNCKYGFIFIWLFLLYTCMYL